MSKLTMVNIGCLQHQVGDFSDETGATEKSAENHEMLIVAIGTTLTFATLLLKSHINSSH